MARLRALFGDLQGYLGQLSPRERRLVALAGGGVAAFVVFIVYISISSAISKHELVLSEKRDELEQISKLSGGFTVAQHERQALEARLKQPPLALFGYIEQIAKQNGVDVTNMSDRGVTPGKEGIKEATVEVTLPKIPLDKLVKMLGQLEQSQNIVKIVKLRLRKSFDDKDALDATLTVAAYQLAS